MGNEVRIIRSVAQRKLNRDRGQSSQEFQYL
jgi:hypothetical protein